MQESVAAAVSVVRARARKLGIKPDFYEKHDLHLHFPEGAVPKDGPSAGIAITTAIVSTLTGVPVKATVGMTGEITLRGEVPPIGGLKENCWPRSGGLTTVLILTRTSGSRRDPDGVKNAPEIRPVKWIDEVLAVALERAPVPLPDDVSPVVASAAAEAASQTEVVKH